MNIDYRMKLMYAFGMIFIVAGHCGNGGISILFDWFPPYSFHLGLFFFVSGYFYKDNSIFNVKFYFLKKCKNLLLPLYCYNILYSIIVLASTKLGFTIGTDNGILTLNKLLITPIVMGNQYMYNLGGWFIIPLFMVQIYNLFLRKFLSIIKINLSEWIIFMLNLVVGMIGIQLARHGYNTDGWLVLVRMMYFIPFYAAGILYNRKLEILDQKINSTLYFAVIIILQLAVIYKFKTIPTFNPSGCDNFNGNLSPIFIGLIGTAFWLRVSQITSSIFINSNFIRSIADNTYSIMINQFIGFMIVKTIFALANLYFGAFVTFDWTKYQTDLMYYYCPGDLHHFYILYLVAGLIIPIYIQIFVDRIKIFIGDFNKH